MCDTQYPVLSHDLRIAGTGEGKTLTSKTPSYLNAISGKGVNIITVNDYLAKRDADWSRPLFEFLEITVDCNIPGLSPA